MTRGGSILAAPVWQRVLPPGRPASLHDSAPHWWPAAGYGAETLLFGFMSTWCHVLIRGVALCFTQLGQDLHRWKDVYAILRGQELLGFQSPEDLEGEDKPSVVIPIKKVCPEHVGGMSFGFGLSSQKCSAGNGVIGCRTSPTLVTGS